MTTDTTTKHWWESRTIWGTLILTCTSIAALFGVQILDGELSAMQQAVAEIAGGLGTLAGVVLGIWGRARATKPIKNPFTPTPMPLLLLAGLLCVIGGSAMMGCQTVRDTYERIPEPQRVILEAAARASLALAIQEGSDALFRDNPELRTFAKFFVDQVTFADPVRAAAIDAGRDLPFAVEAYLVDRLKTEADRDLLRADLLHYNAVLGQGFSDSPDAQRLRTHWLLHLADKGAVQLEAQ